MDLPRNTFKAALRAGQQQFGLWCAIPSSTTAELLAGCGFDWLLIDTEHSTTSFADVAAMMMAMGRYPVAPVVRASWNDTVEIKRLLDAGAQSILVPYVQSAKEAAEAVAAVRYPPAGKRGVATITRATGYGAVENYTARADDEICLLVQAETATALENIEEIAAIDGVDGIFIGPADLAASMGHSKDPGHPDVRAAIVDAVRRIRVAGKPPGILSQDQQLLHELADEGALFIAQGIDAGLMRNAAIALRQSWTSQDS